MLDKVATALGMREIKEKSGKVKKLLKWSEKIQGI